MEILKEFVRTMLFPFVPEEIYAVEGTIKCRILHWLYGEGEEFVDGWIYPDDEG